MRRPRALALEIPHPDHFQHRLQEDVDVGAVARVDPVALDGVEIVKAQK